MATDVNPYESLSLSPPSVYAYAPAPTPIYTAPAPTPFYTAPAPAPTPTPTPVSQMPMYIYQQPPVNFMKIILLVILGSLFIALLGYTIYIFMKNNVDMKNRLNRIFRNRTTTTTNTNSSANTNSLANTCKNGVYSEAYDICMCNGNWSGEECADCGLICSAGGVLDRNACVCRCNPGYAGKTCEIDINNVN